MNLAIQSYCFRNFKDNAKVADMVRECGLDAIELCRVHLDFADAAAVDKAIETYRAAGVRIVSAGVERFADDEARERMVMEFVKKAGAGHVSADFAIDKVPAAYRTAERLAEEYDVRLGIHNHGGRHWLGGNAALAQVFAQTSDRIGLCLDTAWSLDSGENPVKTVGQFQDRLFALHLKDFVFDRARRPEDVVVGTGNVHLPELRAALDAASFNGWFIVEYEGDVENPLPALKECLASIRNEWSG